MEVKKLTLHKIGRFDDDDEVLMSDDGPRAGLLTTRADKKERRNEKVRRAQKTKRTLVLVFLRKETVVVVGRATREVDNENIFWVLLFCDEEREKENEKKMKNFSHSDQQIFRLVRTRGVKL